MLDGPNHPEIAQSIPLKYITNEMCCQHLFVNFSKLFFASLGATLAKMLVMTNTLLSLYRFSAVKSYLNSRSDDTHEAVVMINYAIIAIPGNAAVCIIQ